MYWRQVFGNILQIYRSGFGKTRLEKIFFLRDLVNKLEILSFLIELGICAIMMITIRILIIWVL